MFFIPLALIALAASLTCKTAERHAVGRTVWENLGFNIRRLRIVLLIITGLLTAVVYRLCGPIAFIGGNAALSPASSSARRIIAVCCPSRC